MGVTPLVGDLDRPASLRRLAGLADGVLHLAPPPGEGERDSRTHHLLAALSRLCCVPQLLAYISTTGVYGDCAGAWVRESRACAAASPRARRRVDAERQVRGFGRSFGVRVSVLRAPGIYAADRLLLERLRRGDPVLVAEDDVFTNHIHADDLARAMNAALFRGRPGRCYHACDNSRRRMGDYFDQVADAFGLPRPPRLPRTQIDRHLSPLTLSFMSESRRLDNTRLLRELRLRLRYPDTAAGLAAARVQLESGENPCSG